jgi:hypothetical protein
MKSDVFEAGEEVDDMVSLLLVKIDMRNCFVLMIDCL